MRRFCSCRPPARILSPTPTKLPPPHRTVPPGATEEIVPEETLSDTEQRALVSDDLGEFDFGGTNFRTIVQESCPDDIWVEELTGDVLNDSVFQRNLTVSERFNVNIPEPVTVNYSEIGTRVTKAVTAGDDEYDLVLGQMEDTGALLLKDVFTNWYDIPNVDFTKPWYSKSVVQNSAAINGKLFVIASDMCISYARQTWLMVYDKNAAADFDIPDLYAHVREGTWTIDTLKSVVGSVYVDTNGDGKNNFDDYHGMATTLDGCMLAGYYYGMGQTFASVNDNLEVEMTFGSERAADITSALYSLFYETEGVFLAPNSFNDDGMYGKFTSGKALLSSLQAGSILSKLRDFEHDFGVLPNPKWDETQEEYYSVIDAGCDVLAVPKTIGNPELTGVMTEALSAEGWKKVLPAFHDVALDIKAARDEDTSEMLDIIFENRITEFSYLLDGWGGWTFTLSNLIQTNNFSSNYAKFEKQKRKYYEKVVQFFVEG